jgi:outer membrane protein assembly factor BamD (BamD/ComL family)
MFARAVADKRRGQNAQAIADFDRFMAKYPGSPLAESATVERMRLLRSSDHARALSAAKQYLARYPAGFARAEAEAIVAGDP